MRLALYQPDIPQNAGAIVRLCACLGVPLDVIEPAGFLFTVREMRRVAMDYAPLADVTRHASWTAFLERRAGRLVLLTTKAETRHVDFAFAPDDVLLLGRESAGAPDEVHVAADARLRIPLRPEARSLNVAVAAGMVLGEALRQTGGFP
jgi:tRNA (cytidine/uridine-2'-O-)-methyltransferase